MSSAIFYIMFLLQVAALVKPLRRVLPFPASLRLYRNYGEHEGARDPGPVHP